MPIKEFSKPSFGENCRTDDSLEALTRSRATFTRRDLAMFAHRHSDDKEQFDRVLAALRGSDSLLALGPDGHGIERFTTVSLPSAEEGLTKNEEALARASHRVAVSLERNIGCSVRRNNHGCPI